MDASDPLRGAHANGVPRSPAAGALALELAVVRRRGPSRAPRAGSRSGSALASGPLRLERAQALPHGLQVVALPCAAHARRRDRAAAAADLAGMRSCPQAGSSSESSTIGASSSGGREAKVGVDLVARTAGPRPPGGAGARAAARRPWPPPRPPGAASGAPATARRARRARSRRGRRVPPPRRSARRGWTGRRAGPAGCARRCTRARPRPCGARTSRARSGRDPGDALEEEIDLARRPPRPGAHGLRPVVGEAGPDTLAGRPVDVGGMAVLHDDAPVLHPSRRFLPAAAGTGSLPHALASMDRRARMGGVLEEPRHRRDGRARPSRSSPCRSRRGPGRGARRPSGAHPAHDRRGAPQPEEGREHEAEPRLHLEVGVLGPRPRRARARARPAGSAPVLRAPPSRAAPRSGASGWCAVPAPRSRA